MVGTPDLRPFKAQDLVLLAGRDTEGLESLDMLLWKQNAGPAFTAVYDDVIIGCSGIILNWPGMATAWAVYSQFLVDNWPIWMTRITKRVLRDASRAYQLKRIEVIALESQPRNQAWLKKLGFVREIDGIAHHYTPSGGDIVRLEMLRPV